jgi:hypothetical protein
MDYSIIAQEPLVLVFEVLESDLALTGLEPAFCHVKKAGPNGAVPPPATAPALIMTPQHHAAAGPILENWTFTAADTAGLAPGNYTGDAWLVISGRKQPLFDFTLRVHGNVTVII